MGSHSAVSSATVPTAWASGERIVGLDVARGIALLAMMVTHIISTSDGLGSPTWAAIFAGRASALFAVLAGCSLVLSTTAVLSRPNSRLRDAAPGVLIRAAAITVIGLVLGSISTALAVILVNYGIMFGICLLFLRLRARTLWFIALSWMAVAPLLSMVVRSEFLLSPAYLPMGLFDVAEPGAMFIDLFLTGYYPILQWTAYLLLGMAVAKSDLRSHLPALFACGVGLVTLGKGGSWLLLEAGSGHAALAAEPLLFTQKSLEFVLHVGSYGITPPTSWWWLAIAGPHSGTPFDLFATAGTAVAMIAVCQAAVARLGSRVGLLLPLSGPGSMPLSVYSGHVLLAQVTHHFLSEGPAAAESAEVQMTYEWIELAIHVALTIVLAMLWKTFIAPRGPLEAAIAGIIRRRATR